MKKVNLNNLYESPYPPANINVLWVDKDESTGDIKAIHKYDHATMSWVPYLVSVDYLKPDEEPDNGGQGPEEPTVPEENENV